VLKKLKGVDILNPYILWLCRSIDNDIDADENGHWSDDDDDNAVACCSED